MLTILISGMVQAQTFNFGCFNASDYLDSITPGSMYNEGVYSISEHGDGVTPDNRLNSAVPRAILDSPLADYILRYKIYETADESSIIYDYNIGIVDGRIAWQHRFIPIPEGYNGVQVRDNHRWIQLYISRDFDHATSVVVISNYETEEIYWKHNELN